MEWIKRSGIPVGIFPVLELLAPELQLFISSRVGGVSSAPYDTLNLGKGPGDRPGDVFTNRRLLLGALGIPAGRVARAGQVHGAGIKVVKRGGIQRNVDGLITNTRNLTLAISTADCYPVIIYSPPEKALAAIHVGRRGAELGIIEKALERLIADFRINLDYTICIIGPGICEKCYTVGEPAALRFPEKTRKLRGSSWHLNLLSFCTFELRKCGVKRKNIHRAGLCTACNTDIFFSYRKSEGITGRSWTLATIGSSP